MKRFDFATRLLFSVDEAAYLLGVGPHTIYRAIRRKRLPAIRIGEGERAKILIDKSSLLRFIAPPAVEEER